MLVWPRWKKTVVVVVVVEGKRSMGVEVRIIRR